jgi:hypothetical protein
LEFDSKNELDDCTLLDVVVDDNIDEDDDTVQECVWEDMNNYKGQRENFSGSIGTQSAGKDVTEVLDVFKFFFKK